ncbi:hypothetical protein PROFUN_12684 [Planoprotostelium fungivorum]|uniref:Uncharacterized protein n=1 Tax=Planoprotostelium fungivorum TaxID=1890364 RepID=A0A2P6N6V8_9EUKA|nr:hypothetical protein PROFUN_12684 [Planoprotostelium fungivorum]
MTGHKKVSNQFANALSGTVGPRHIARRWSFNFQRIPRAHAKTYFFAEHLGDKI